MKTDRGVLRWIACAAVAGMLLSITAGGQTSKKRGPAGKTSELQALQQRQQRLASKIESDEWKMLLRDFELWAKDHGVPSETRSSAAQSKCRPNLEGSGPRYHCILDTSRTTAAKCVYRCYRM